MTAETAVRIDGATKIYGSGDTEVTAVDGASLEVARGSLLLVMGPSGSGKTTLLAMCGGLLRPNSGRIWIDGTEITSLPERKLPDVRLRQVGFVFQAFNLLANLTAAENVRIVLTAAGANRRDADRRARELLTELGLGRRLDALPDQLSGGEKQRVAVARALANDPQVILADEPTGNLDSRTGYAVMHMLEDLAHDRGKTVVAVTHDHRIQEVADRVVWLEDGRLTDRAVEEPVLVRDPVCGMSIDPEHAAGHRTWRGVQYAFCSDRCIARFDASPDRYVAPPPGDGARRSLWSAFSRRRPK